MKNLNHTGSSFSILFGFLLLLSGISATSADPSKDSVPVLNLGITLIVGGLIYRSSKNRRNDWGNLHIVKMTLELLGVVVILFLLFGAGISYFKNTLYNDPAWPIVALITVFAWLASNMMPKVVGEAVEKKRSKEEIRKSLEPELNVPEKQKSTFAEASPLLQPGLYRVEGAEFRVYSSGRIVLLKSDIKPLGDEVSDFKSIGWFLRAFPDIEIRLLTRISD